MYKSIQNTLSKKRNDTLFELDSELVIQNQDIIKNDMDCFLSAVQLNVIPDLLVRDMLKVTEKNNNVNLVSINHIAEKLIFIDCETHS